MADRVQYRMERMVDELEDFEKKGLFNKPEISEIVRQRRKFEYRLRRPSPLKKDFLAYIEFEKQLDSLRMMRKKAAPAEHEGPGSKRKKRKRSVSDFACINRIKDIYRLAVRRFKGDINIWFQYLEFCRERGNTRMKKVLAEVIRFHPKVPGVWIYAASWEFDCNLNALAARALMQSGLRACPKSEDLWVEYIRMELTYINKLRARKEAIAEANTAGEERLKEGDADGFISLSVGESVKPRNEEEEEEMPLLEEQACKFLHTVYTSAIESVPSNLNLRRRFLEIAESEAYFKETKDQMVLDIKRDFVGDPECWDWLARRESVRTRAMEVYEEALKTATPSPLMFGLYMKYLKEGDEGDVSDRLSSVFERAAVVGCVDEDLAIDRVSLYVNSGRAGEARRLAEQVCCSTEDLSSSSRLWCLRISIEMMRIIEESTVPGSKTDMEIVFKLTNAALSKIPIAKSESLWHMALKLFSGNRKYLYKLIDLSVYSVARDGSSDTGFSLSSIIIDFILLRDGIHGARQIYKRFLALPCPGLKAYKSCIEIERNVAYAGGDAAIVRKLFEGALSAHPQQESLWKAYHVFEMKMGTSETVNGVYWRAMKTLGDDVFIQSTSF